VIKLSAELNLAVNKEAPRQVDAELQTPVTPVLVEGLILLQNLILERDA
jgi:hypothetical protein